MQINFCRRCGAHLHMVHKGTFRCEQGHTVFYKSFPAAGVLLVNDKNEVLLAVRGIDPGKGMLDIPGGFCEWAEDYETAAKRELHEELGLQPTDYEQPRYLMTGIDEYLFEGEHQPVLAVLYWAKMLTRPKLRIQDDVADAIWVPLAKVDLNKFPASFKTVRQAVDLLRKKLT